MSTWDLIPEQLITKPEKLFLKSDLLKILLSIRSRSEPGAELRFLTGQEVALSVQDFLNVSDPHLLDVDVGGLQRETL